MPVNHLGYNLVADLPMHVTVDSDSKHVFIRARRVEIIIEFLEGLLAEARSYDAS